MQLLQLWDAVGGLSKTTKMPGYSWSIPPSECKTGSALRAQKVNGPCTVCYARKGHYTFPVVQGALINRLNIYHRDPDEWIGNMVRLLNHPRIAASGYFRWFDAGDLQSPRMLDDICLVATNTTMKHYLPTKERRFVKMMQFGIPTNLAVRHSLPIFNQKRDDSWVNWWMPQSTQQRRKILTCAVVTDGSETCPALKQGNNCGDCRKCWDRRVTHVTYRRH